MYPYSNKASSVLEVLLSELNKEQIDFHTSTRVAAVRSCGEGYEIDVDEVLAVSHQGKGTSAQAVRCCAPRKARIKTARVVLALQKFLLFFGSPSLAPLGQFFQRGFLLKASMEFVLKHESLFLREIIPKRARFFSVDMVFRALWCLMHRVLSYQVMKSFSI